MSQEMKLVPSKCVTEALGKKLFISAVQGNEVIDLPHGLRGKEVVIFLTKWILLPPVLCGLVYGVLPLNDHREGLEKNMAFFLVWLPVAGMLAGWGLSNLAMCLFNMFTSERSKIYHRFNVQIKKELQEEEFLKNSEKLHAEIREEKDDKEQLRLLLEFKKREEKIVSLIMKQRDIELIPHQKKRSKITLVYSAVFTVSIIVLYLLFGWLTMFPTPFGFIAFCGVGVFAALYVFTIMAFKPILYPPKKMEDISEENAEYKEKGELGESRSYDLKSVFERTNKRFFYAANIAVAPYIVDAISYATRYACHSSKARVKQPPEEDIDVRPGQ